MFSMFNALILALVLFCAEYNNVLASPINIRDSDSVQAALDALGRHHLHEPGTLRNSRLPAGTDTMPGIEHIVMLMMENLSFDNIWGMLGRGDGFKLDSSGKPIATNPYPNGSIQHAFHMPTTCQLQSQPSQEWLAAHNSYDNGTLDGFVRTPISSTSSEIVGGVAMGYWTGDDLPFMYDLGKTFPIADRWFSSLLGQTYPNRQYLIAATSRGLTDDTEDFLTSVPPNGTIFTMLDKYKISWENYVSSFPLGATPELYPITDSATEALHNAPFDQFFTDASAGKLPNFSFLDPDYDTNSEENPQNIVLGEALTYDVVNAIGASPLWNKTLLILNYDEWGGYYDHVAPPAALAPDSVPPSVAPGEYVYEGFHRYGFRVPAVLVGPYVKKNHVSHDVYDHTSVLAFLERKWNLPSMTFRDANANDLLDFLDLKALENGEPTFPVLPVLAKPGNTTEALKCSTTGPGVIPPPGSVTSH
jgi:phospholipase C